MTYLPKPKLKQPGRKTNSLGLSKRDYEAGLSTLCAGCGHDSVTAAIIEACFGLELEPHRVAKMSGIGCSSKTPGYFMADAHGFNSVHGRMPSVTTGAYLADSSMTYIGISGDGDTTAIGIGQFLHGARRNLNMTYIVENNGVYGLTKGQFSASADVGSKTKKGDINPFAPIDPVVMAIQMGAGFVARSFSGDKRQLVPLLQAAISYQGFALVDVISPCVTFNNHQGSTRSYSFTRDHYEILNHVDFVPRQKAIEVESAKEDHDIQLFDGSILKLSQLPENIAMTDRQQVLSYLAERKAEQKVVTGLLHYREPFANLKDIMNLPPKPLRHIPLEELAPSEQQLRGFNEAHR